MQVWGGWGPYTRADDAFIIGYIAEWLNSFHIYTFTMISGYIFYYIKYEKGNYQQYLPFLKNKVLRLLVPYVFVATVWVAPINKILLPNESIIDMFVLGKAPRQLWFLLMLFWVFAVFWLISDVANRHPFLGIIIIGILYIIGFFVPNYFCLGRGLQYVIYFYAGFLVRKCGFVDRILYKMPSIVYLGVDILLFILSKRFTSNGTMLFQLLDIALGVVLHLFGAIGAFVILQRFVNRFVSENNVINRFSKHSMAIYLIHQQLIYFSIGWFNGIVSPIILVIINFVFSLSVSTLFSVVMNKTRIGRILIGNK